MSDLQQILSEVQDLLGTAAACAWYSDDGRVIHPVRCHPARWLETHALLPQPAEEFTFSSEPESVSALLPKGIRMRDGQAPAAAIVCAYRDLEKNQIVGLIGAWTDVAAVPANLRLIIKTILQAIGHLVWESRAAGELVKDSPQVRSLSDALPQGVVIVPIDGRTGFVNASASALLSMTPGEVEAGALAESLHRFVRKACDPETVAAFANRVLTGRDVAMDQRTTVWRFHENPRALRVTISPVNTTRTVAWVWLLEDVSRETLLREELAVSEQKFRSFYQSLRDTVVFYDMSGRPTECNAALFRLLRTSHWDVMQLTASDLGWEPQDWTAVAAECVSAGSSGPHERKLVRSNGAVVHVESSAYLRRDPEGRPEGFWEVLHDVTERKNAEAQLILSAEAFARNTDGVILTDADEVILTVNDAFCRVSGFNREDLRGKKPSMLQSGRHDERFYEQMRRSINHNGWWQGGVWNRGRDGQLFFKWLTVNAVRDEQGELTHFVGVYRDAVAVRAAKRQIEYMATHDGLTQLPNAVLFEDRLQYALDHCPQSRPLLGVVVVELMGLQRINGGMGIAAGDAILKSAAARLRSLSRDSPVVARISGDRFAALVEASSPDELAQYGEMVLGALNASHTIQDRAVTAPACIGISAYPRDGQDAQTLLFNARAALQRAKSLGANGMQFFAAEMSREISEHFQLESDLRRAMERNELRIHYQAQVSSLDGAVAGCEALLRWQRESGLEGPNDFLPIAEASNLIVPITYWVLQQVCHDIKVWDAQGVVIPTVSVNISARHFQLDDMIERLLEILHRECIDPSRICLEITEGALASPEHSEGKINALKEAGFVLSIDDFGTGFSSLSYLRRFRLDELKIDRSFVKGIAENRADRALVDAILSMAHGLGLSVVAEGVENQDQLNYLVRRGCGRLQGYFYMRPADAAGMQAFAQARGRMNPVVSAFRPQAAIAS